MNQRNRILQTYGVWLIDMVCIVISYIIATQIRFAVSRDFGNKTLHYMVMVVMLLFCTVFNFFMDWNRNILKRGMFREMVEIIRFNALMIIFSLVFVFFARWSDILSRSVILNFAWINLVLMYILHTMYKKFARKYFSVDHRQTKVLIVCRKSMEEATLENLQKNLGISYQTVGSVYVHPGMTEDEYRHITERLTQTAFDEVYIYTPGLSQAEIAPLIEGFQDMGVTCHYSVTLPNVGSAVTSVEKFGGSTVITYSKTIISYKKLLIKRFFDILGGIVGLILTGVIMIFLAPAIKLDSPGPVFFSQIRVGKNGRRFRLYKFRSMYTDAEDRLKDLMSQNEINGLMFKMENDPRVTKVGKFIRKTSLDEFPQFWNVLKGDMSLVGTRPPTEQEFEQYDEHYRRRLSMTPGLTGMWQVSGRSDISDFDEVVKLDLYYIDHWSLLLDFKILLQTVAVVFAHKGAK